LKAPKHETADQFMNTFTFSAASEGSDYFSVEVIMDIISSLITNAITIIGLIVTYHMMKLQFVNQSKNAKEQEVLEKMSDIPYEILDLMTEMQQPGFKANNRFERKLSDLWSKIYAYGSQETIRILSKMQSESYQADKEVSNNSEEKYRRVAYYVLLVAQIKYDVTGILISPETWYEFKIKDYQEHREEIIKNTNDLIKELGLTDISVIV
jgi:hypothetical protein